MGYADGFYLLKWKKHDRGWTFGRWENYEDGGAYRGFTGTFDVIGSDEIFTPVEFSEILGPLSLEAIKENYNGLL
jgi:hypothetical protein